MAARLAQVAPRTVEAVSFPSYAPTSQDLEVRTYTERNTWWLLGVMNRSDLHAVFPSVCQWHRRLSVDVFLGP